MTPTTITQAVTEARRFLERAEQWHEAQGTGKWDDGTEYRISTPKQDGALRRASMDLTRALAEMRRR